MRDLGITATEYDQLAKLCTPLRQNRPAVAALRKAQPRDLSEVEGRREEPEEVFEVEEEEEGVDQLEADDYPVPLSSRKTPALSSTSVSQDLTTVGSTTRARRLSRVSPYAVAARLSSAGRMRREGFPVTSIPSDLELVPFRPAATFKADDGGRLLKELAAIRLALVMAQEKLDVLLSDYDVPEESVGVAESSGRNTPDVVPPRISTQKADVGTSGPDTASQLGVPFEDVTQEFRISETRIRPGQGIDGLRELPDTPC